MHGPSSSVWASLTGWNCIADKFVWFLPCCCQWWKTDRVSRDNCSWYKHQHVEWGSCDICERYQVITFVFLSYCFILTVHWLKRGHACHPLWVEPYFFLLFTVHSWSSNRISDVMLYERRSVAVALMLTFMCNKICSEIMKLLYTVRVLRNFSG
jgi:hypothetical protein